MIKDNIIIEKKWQEENLIELKIIANSEYVSAYQSCYIQEDNLITISKKIIEFTYNYKKKCYVEFGKKEGNYTPAFSMCFLPADLHGNVKIELDLEISDNNTRSHRCCFYVNSELGLVEKFGKGLLEIIKEKEGIKITLSNT